MYISNLPFLYLSLVHLSTDGIYVTVIISQVLHCSLSWLEVMWSYQFVCVSFQWTVWWNLLILFFIIKIFKKVPLFSTVNIILKCMILRCGHITTTLSSIYLNQHTDLWLVMLILFPKRCMKTLAMTYDNNKHNNKHTQ